MPVEAGRCRILAARALAQAGRRDAAIAELEHAADGAVARRRHRLQAEAEKELRRLGRRRRRPAGAGADGEGLAELTEREREIAELVGQGHTNREIAAATYLSEKTVERHLSRIFAKLGIANRTALALLHRRRAAARRVADADPRTARLREIPPRQTGSPVQSSSSSVADVLGAGSPGRRHRCQSSTGEQGKRHRGGSCGLDGYAPG